MATMESTKTELKRAPLHLKEIVISYTTDEYLPEQLSSTTDTNTAEVPHCNDQSHQLTENNEASSSLGSIENGIHKIEEKQLNSVNGGRLLLLVPDLIFDLSKDESTPTSKSLFRAARINISYSDDPLNEMKEQGNHDKDDVDEDMDKGGVDDYQNNFKDGNEDNTAGGEGDGANEEEPGSQKDDGNDSNFDRGDDRKKYDEKEEEIAQNEELSEDEAMVTDNRGGLVANEHDEVMIIEDDEDSVQILIQEIETITIPDDEVEIGTSSYMDSIDECFEVITLCNADARMASDDFEVPDFFEDVCRDDYIVINDGGVDKIVIDFNKEEVDFIYQRLNSCKSNYQPQN